MGGQSGMGGAVTPQATGTSPDLAQAFMGNQATQGATLPTIMQPQRAMPDISAMLPRPAVQPPVQTAPPVMPFADMSKQQRLGMMAGGKFNTQTGKIDLPDNMDRETAIAMRNAGKGAVNSGETNPFSKMYNNFRGGSGRGM